MSMDLALLNPLKTAANRKEVRYQGRIGLSSQADQCRKQ